MNEIMMRIREKRYNEIGFGLTVEFMRKMLMDETNQEAFVSLLMGLEDGSISNDELHKEGRAPVLNEMETEWNKLISGLAAAREELELSVKSEAELTEDSGRWMEPAALSLTKG